MSAEAKTDDYCDPKPEPTNSTLTAGITDHAAERWLERVAPDDADIHSVPRHDAKQTIELAWQHGDPVHIDGASYHWARRADPQTLGGSYIELQEPAFLLAIDTRDELGSPPATVVTVLSHSSSDGGVSYEFIDDPTAVNE